MCGIAGILRISSSASVPPLEAIPEVWLDILDEGIKHRGPDGHGRFRDRAANAQNQTIDVALVHRRLSIIDHADGAQPMVASGGSAIVFNGCIYNHRTLRRDLVSLGCDFTTNHSDTEALLQGWLQWGPRLFERVDGMYAVAWWNRSSASLTLARDPFGEKPLYWAEWGSRNGVRLRAFASTVPAIVSLYKAVNGACPLDTKSLAQWIQFGWGQSLPYQFIHELPPGTLAALTDSQCRPIETANNAALMINTEISNPLTADDIDQLLRASVHSRLEADVPMGFFLSGGIDSALVCKYAAEKIPDLTAFTVQMPDPAFDESSAAKQTAAFLRISHMVLPCHAKPAEDLESLIAQLGLPFGDSSLLPSMWVSRAARSHSTVAFGGDGSDELFLGYDRHRVMRPLWLASHLPRFALRAIATALSMDADPKSTRTRLSRFLAAAAHGGYGDLLAIFSSSACGELGVASRLPRNSLGSWQESLKSNRKVDALNYLPLDLLRKSDTASMHTALELRAPFLSRDVARAVLAADLESLMPNGERKGLLRSVARRYLPDSIVDRPKQGFAIPIGDWFRTDYGGMKTLLLDTLNSADPFPESKLGLSIKRNAVARLVDEHMQKKRDHSQRLYMLMVLGIWARSEPASP